MRDVEELERENEMLREQAARAGKLARALRKALDKVPLSEIQTRRDILKALNVNGSDSDAS